MSCIEKPTGLQYRATDASVHLDAIAELLRFGCWWATAAHYLSRRLSALFSPESYADSTSSAVQKTESILTKHLRIGQLLIGRPILSRMAVIAFFVLSGYLVGGSVLRSCAAVPIYLETIPLHA